MKASLGLSARTLDDSYIRLGNALNEYFDVILFTHEPAFIETKPKISIMRSKEMFNFNGHLLCFDLVMAELALICPVIQILYLFTTTKLWAQPVPYENLQNIFMSDARLLVSNEEEFETVQTIWKKPHAIVNDFKLESITDLLIGDLCQQENGQN